MVNISPTFKIELFYKGTSYFSRHPDKNKDPEAENNFIDVNKAYDVCQKYVFVFYFIPNLS